MTGSILEWAIIAFIVGSILFIVWKSGSANPVGTGGIDKRLSQIGSDLTKIETRVGSVESRVQEVERKAATVEDVRQLEAKIAEMKKALERRQAKLSDQLAEHQERSAQTASTVEHIDRQVGRMLDVIIPKGMS